jgi:hypothetical protein
VQKAGNPFKHRGKEGYPLKNQAFLSIPLYRYSPGLSFIKTIDFKRDMMF